MDKILLKIKKLIPRKLFKKIQPVYHFILSWLAAVICRHPSEELIVIGVTGTTGKTTSVYLIAKMLEGAGYKTGFTSTAILNDGRKERLNDKKMTMIGRFFTQRILRRMVSNGCRFAVVETTSEGVMQYRHRFINYDILLVTGIYPEHIEAHGSFENYKRAKGRLFAHLSKCRPKFVNEQKQVVKAVSGLKKLDLEQVKKTIVANGDDEHAEYFLSFSADKKIVYQNSALAAREFPGINIIKYGEIEVSGTGTGVLVGNTRLRLRLLGEFNAVNAASAAAVGEAAGLPMASVRIGLESVEGVAGRLERIDEGQEYTVIVDYAYEPGAVARLYETVQYIPHRQIIHVLGSTGGGRDIARRPILGRLAGENADLVIITNEDPYDDDPSIIIDQVALGAEKAGKKLGQDLFKVLDRRQAICQALNSAGPEDLVLITGKGSEQAICVADGEKIPWDDRAVVRGLLRGV